MVPDLLDGTRAWKSENPDPQSKVLWEIGGSKGKLTWYPYLRGNISGWGDRA
jgi:hypothetical protein